MVPPTPRPTSFPITNPVALINMPFAPADRASVQIAILKAVLERTGIGSDEIHANLDFYRQLQEHDAHRPYSSTLPSLVGEWLFSRQPAPDAAEWQAAAGDVDSPLTRLQDFAGGWGASYEDLLAFRDEVVPSFMDALIESRDWSGYRVLAFTVTYPQFGASFWLAEELKRRHPHLKTVFGGALSQVHMDSARAYMKAFEFIDHVVVGEAEPVFDALCKQLLDEEPEAGHGLDGVFVRVDGEVIDPGAVALCERFDEAPFPDYRGFQQAREAMPRAVRDLITKDIPVEMARGCVWAVKKVCSFCGFYPDGGYRRKSNDKVLEELTQQQETLGWRSFFSLDAYIPHGLLNGVFRRLPEEQPDVTFPFIELRTKMKRPEMEVLVDAGVTLVQPGIECLEEGLLDKILKGVTLTDNLFFLKWGRELGLEVSWNMLLGLPDATVEEMERQLMISGLITHLAPPSPTRLLFVRESTYCLRPDDYRLTNMRPDPFYALIHPPHLDLDAVAYEFQADWELAPFVDVLERTVSHIERWRSLWSDGTPPTLTWESADDRVLVEDRRDGAPTPHVIALEGARADVFMEILDIALAPDAIELHTSRGPEEVAQALASLVDDRLLLETRGKFFALATAKTPRSLTERVKNTRRRWRDVSRGSTLNILD